MLSSRLQLQTRSYAVRGKFSQRMVKDDADSILGLYQANGFLHASVKAQVIDDVKGKTGDLSVHYDIVEGPQTKVAELKMEGNQTIDTKDLMDVIGLVARRALFGEQPGGRPEQYSGALLQRRISGRAGGRTGDSRASDAEQGKYRIQSHGRERA